VYHDLSTDPPSLILNLRWVFVPKEDSVSRFEGTIRGANMFGKVKSKILGLTCLKVRFQSELSHNAINFVLCERIIGELLGT
jgi:hypothetical protein